MSTETLTAGWARAEITPPLGSRLRGYFHERLAEGIHDPLMAKAVYLSDGHEALALVACDLCSVDAGTVARARELVAGRCGLAPERLIVHCTHTHLGPFSVEHLEFLAQRIALAAEQAIWSAGPVSAERASGHEDTVAFCRRFRMKDGTVRTNPGRRNPDVAGPTAPIDPEVGVLRLTNRIDGRQLVLVNFALHLDTVGGCVYGADYPFFLERTLKRAYGPHLDAMFVQGCSGDVNHIDVGRADQPKGFAQAEEIGTVLAGEVIKALARASAVELTPIRYQHRLLEFGVEVPTDEQVAEAWRIRESTEKGMKADLVGASRTIALAERGSPIRVEVDAARLGEVVLAAMPGELFCDYGLRLKASSPGVATVVAELCHDDLRYIPTRAGKEAGGYESWNSLLPPEAGDTMIACAMEIIASGQQG